MLIYMCLRVVSKIVFEGKMRTLFSMLFGAGVILLTSRIEARGGQAHLADIYYRRNLWHHPLLVLEDGHQFLVIDRDGPGDNCVEHFFTREQGNAQLFP